MLSFSASTFDQAGRVRGGGGYELAVGSAITPTQEGARKKGLESLFPPRRLPSDTLCAKKRAERQLNELLGAAAGAAALGDLKFSQRRGVR